MVLFRTHQPPVCLATVGWLSIEYMEFESDKQKAGALVDTRTGVAKKPTLLLQSAPYSTVFRYDASYWTTANTLNPQHSTEKANVDAKLMAFNTLPLLGLRVCTGTAHNCYEYMFPASDSYLSTRPTALELFSHTFTRAAFDASRFEHIFGHTMCGTYQCSKNGCNMQRPGFNTICNDGNKARWGFCDNIESQACQPSDTNDADRAIGIGLAGQSNSYASAGVVGYPRQGAYGSSPQLWLYGIHQPFPGKRLLACSLGMYATCAVCLEPSCPSVESK